MSILELRFKNAPVIACGGKSNPAPESVLLGHQHLRMTWGVALCTWHFYLLTAKRCGSPSELRPLQSGAHSVLSLGSGYEFKHSPARGQLWRPSWVMSQVPLLLIRSKSRAPGSEPMPHFPAVHSCLLSSEADISVGPLSDWDCSPVISASNRKPNNHGLQNKDVYFPLQVCRWVAVPVGEARCWHRRPRQCLCHSAVSGVCRVLLTPICISCAGSSVM